MRRKSTNDDERLEQRAEYEPACSEDPRIGALQAVEHCLQAAAEQAEDLCGRDSLPAVAATHDAQLLAMSPGVQALWHALLPLVGAMPSRPGEYPGVFKVEAGESEHEAIVFIDVPSRTYEPGRKGDMARVLALKVTLDHDYRKLGDKYYCIDCESPAEETRH